MILHTASYQSGSLKKYGNSNLLDLLSKFISRTKKLILNRSIIISFLSFILNVPPCKKKDTFNKNTEKTNDRWLIFDYLIFTITMNGLTIKSNDSYPMIVP